MRMIDIVKQYKKNFKEFIEENKNDVVMLNMDFHCYLDNLCRDGVITEYQRIRAKNPFKKRGRK